MAIVQLKSWKRWGAIAWAIIGIALVVIGCFYAVGQIWTSISIILFSALLVFILRVPVGWMAKHGVPRVAGAAISYVVALAIIALVLLIFLPVIFSQIVGFVSQIPSYVDQARQIAGGVYERYHDLVDNDTVRQIFSSLASSLSGWATDFVSQSAGGIVQAGSSVANVFLVVGVSVIVGFWVLIDLPKIRRELLVIFGEQHREDVQFIARTCSRALGGYLKSMIVSCICTGTMAGICYTIIGLPYPVVFALFTGLMVFIPFVGPVIAWLLAGIMGLFISPLTAVLAIVLTIIPQVINDNLIAPRVMAGNVQLHPAVTLVVITIGGALGGVFGMLCAVPLTSAAKTLFVYYFEKGTGRQIVSSDGAFFKGKPAASDGAANPVCDASDSSISSDDLSKSAQKTLSGADDDNGEKKDKKTKKKEETRK
jgi:predicted PurR-regulated permease PerM